MCGIPRRFSSGSPIRSGAGGPGITLKMIPGISTLPVRVIRVKSASTFWLDTTCELSASKTVYSGTDITFHLHLGDVQKVENFFNEPVVIVDFVAPVSGVTGMKAGPIIPPLVLGEMYTCLTCLPSRNVYLVVFPHRDGSEMTWLVSMSHCSIIWLAIERTRSGGSMPLADFFEKDLQPGVPP